MALFGDDAGIADGCNNDDNSLVAHGGDAGGCRHGGRRSNVRTPKDHTTWEMLQSLDYYLFLVILVGAMGTGTMVSNNMAQIVQASGGGSNAHGIFVSLFSIANSLGRMLVGLWSDLYKDTITRPLFLVGASAMMSFAALLLAVSGFRTLYLGVFLVGGAHGCLWNLMPSIISDLFGLKHFGGNYSGMRWCPSLGSLFISTLLAGTLYDLRATEGVNADDDHDHVCYGPECFRLTFFISSAICAVCCALSVIFYQRTKSTYHYELV